MESRNVRLFLFREIPKGYKVFLYVQACIDSLLDSRRRSHDPVCSVMCASLDTHDHSRITL